MSNRVRKELTITGTTTGTTTTVPVTLAEPAGPVDLTFLDINDFHGRIDANTVKFAGTVEQQRAAARRTTRRVRLGR